MNILGWPHWRILAVSESEYDCNITAEQIAAPSCCIHCQSHQLYRHEIKCQPFLDIPIRAKRTEILVTRRRYRCLTCQRTFFEVLPDMDTRHLMTTRLVDHIGREALRHTFASISEDVGLDEKTIRVIFHEATAHLNNLKAVAPEWLGIDELYLLHKPRCILTDIRGHQAVDILHNRNKSTVVNWLMRLPERHSVKLVCSDMWRPYKDAVSVALPGAKIIVDRFHITKMANEALESTRKTIKAQLSDAQRRTLKMHDRYILLHRYADLDERKRLILETWTENIPLLKSAYDLKESFFNIWDSDTRANAQELYQAWEHRIPSELEEAFRPLTTAMSNWHEEVFNFFDHRITAGYTESLNGLVKLAQRLGRGYSFEAIRAKVLLTGGLRKNHRSQRGKRQKQKRLFKLKRGRVHHANPLRCIFQ